MKTQIPHISEERIPDDASLLALQQHPDLLRRLQRLLGLGVGAAVVLEFLSRVLYFAYGMPYKITGTMTLLAVLAWGVSSMYVVVKLRSVPWVVRTVVFGSGCMITSQVISLGLYFHVRWGTPFLPISSMTHLFLEEGTFVVGLGFIFTGFYLSLFELYRSSLRMEQERRTLAREVDERVRAQEALLNNREELRQLNVALEQRVAERTVELTDANAKLRAEVALRRDTEAALRDSETKYRMIIENSVDRIWQTDLDMVFTYINPTPTPDVAFTPADIVGRSLGEFVAPAEFARFKALLAEQLRGGPPYPTLTVETEGLTKIGKREPIEVRVRVLVNGDGVPTGVQGLTRDITERRRAEAERESLRRQLLESQKMETVGRLAGGIAHDFNNQLGIILGRAEMASHRLDSASPVATDLASIQKAAQRSAELTKQLLAFARKQPVSPRPFDVNAVVADVLDMVRRLAGETIEVIWNPCAERVVINADLVQFKQMLMNLSINARDAISDKGRILVETDLVSVDETFSATREDCTPGEYVMIAVSDNGAGMDKQVLSHVFEPFFTTKEVGKGTGLGLATVHGFVKQNGGFVNVISEPGCGTTFSVYLPKYAGVLRESTGEVAPSATAGGNETVLLVEDEPEFLDMVRLMLQRQGYTVVGVGSPEQALCVAEDYAGQIQLLLTDVVMPDMNGRELAQRLQSRFPGLKCLFMSGYTARVALGKETSSGGDLFLSKPFTATELADKVRAALDRA